MEDFQDDGGEDEEYDPEEAEAQYAMMQQEMY